jgi:hypothetical protein
MQVKFIEKAEWLLSVKRVCLPCLPICGMLKKYQAGSGESGSAFPRTEGNTGKHGKMESCSDRSRKRKV